MSHDVFISYKREDEAHAARLAQALEADGLRVWWDRGLPAGESWHQQIEAALEAAACTVVLWSQRSTGPAGQYVRDEARRAKARDRLVPALLEPIAIPLGFGELQAVNLMGWKGARTDPFYLDLLASVRAKIAGQPAPAARAARLQWRRRLTRGGAASGLALLLGLLAADGLSLRRSLCTLPWGQPALADHCGRLGWGGQPTQAERLAWQAREPGSCQALRAHVQRFPEGVFRAQAADLLAARRELPGLAPSVREAAGYVRQPLQGQASEALARQDAGRRAEADARSLACAPQTQGERLERLEIHPIEFRCQAAAQGGQGCALDYRVRCELQSPQVQERCG